MREGEREQGKEKEREGGGSRKGREKKEGERKEDGKRKYSLLQLILLLYDSFNKYKNHNCILSK